VIGWALPCLLSGALLSGAQDVRDVAPGGGDGRLPESVRKSLASLDSAAAGWGSEVLAEAAKAVLTKIEAGLAGGPTAGLGVHACPEFELRFGPLPVEDARRPGPLAVLPLERQRLPEPLAEQLRGPEGLVALVERWRATDSERLEAHLKVISVAHEPASASARTRLRLELAGHGPAGVRQVTAELDAVWELAADAPPRLASLEFIRGDQVLAAAGPLFVDVTAAALAGPALDQQLVFGLDHWRDRIDTTLGVGTLGHQGLALGDVNGDGLDDIYVCQPGGLPNRLFLRRPDGTTEEVAARAGVDVLDASSSALIVDLDGDGARDLVLAAAGEVVVFKGDGQAGFRGAARFPAPGATSLAAADVDLDGDLDLFVCGYVSPYDGTGAPEPYHDARNGQRNLLLYNQGGWRFRDGTDKAGLGDTRFSFAAAFEDIDDDGDMDLYVANDFGRNQMYRNLGDGTFEDAAAELGVEDLSAGMGVAFADVDGDGRPDLHVANMFSAAGNRVAYQRRFQAGADGRVRADYQRHARGNSLFLNRGPEGFVDVSAEAGIGMGRWAWGAIFLDFENDGLPDLYVPNGFVTGTRKDDL
jgi:FG-GAP-like repeat